METPTTIQEEQELTPEQKKVLGQVYRLILSWECETPDKEESGKTSNVAPVLEAKP